MIDLLSIAYHEAGHAVIDIHLGFRPTAIRLTFDRPDKKNLPHTDVQLPSEKELAVDSASLLAPIVNGLLAGTIAFKLHRSEPVEPPPQFSQMGDNEEVLGAFRLVFSYNDGSMGSPDNYFNTRWRETVEMVRDLANWQAITRLAEELVVCTCIESPEEILRITQNE